MGTTETNISIQTKRIIGEIHNPAAIACCFFIAGIHGNEASGVKALQEVFKEIDEKDIVLKGSFYGIAGNIPGLQEGKRYCDTDLNRLWTERRMKSVVKGNFKAENEEEREMVELYELIEEIQSKEYGPFYFYDLHTTSAATIPFITVNDSLLNRKFTEQYPVPLILGIEEYLDGPMLSYYNEKGFVSFGFEGGEHYDEQSVKNHKAFIYLSLVYSGVVDRSLIDYDRYYQVLASQCSTMAHFHEIYYRYEIGEHDQFKMEDGYVNFQQVGKDQLLAKMNGQEVKAEEESMIFMPLYQNSGNDGFFLIRQTPEIFLRLSSFFRWIRLDRILPILPGVVWVDKQKEKLLVDIKIARFLAKPFLHLLGYRAKRLEGDVLIIKNREAMARKNDYKNTPWYK